MKQFEPPREASELKPRARASLSSIVRGLLPRPLHVALVFPSILQLVVGLFWFYRAMLHTINDGHARTLRDIYCSIQVNQAPYSVAVMALWAVVWGVRRQLARRSSGRTEPDAALRTGMGWYLLRIYAVLACALLLLFASVPRPEFCHFGPTTERDLFGVASTALMGGALRISLLFVAFATWSGARRRTENDWALKFAGAGHLALFAGLCALLYLVANRANGT